MVGNNLSFKQDNSDQNLLIWIAILLPFVIWFWFYSRKSNMKLGFNFERSKQARQLEIVEQCYLPRGGFLLKIRISDSIVYFIENNKQYLQVDLDKAQLHELSGNDKDE